MSDTDLYDVIQEEKLVAIVRGVDSDVVVKIAEALHAGGVNLMEITCNTPGVADMIRAVKGPMAGRMRIGAGTVVTRELAEQVLDAGAEYVIAPDVNPEVIAFCVERNVAVIPGAATATEVLTAKRLGARMVKIFPAGALGFDTIKQLRGPINDVPFVAVGGVTIENVAAFLQAGCAGAGAGSALVKKDLVANGNWPALTELARAWKQKVAPGAG